MKKRFVKKKVAFKNLVLIDGHYFLFRSFAVPFSFSSDKGTPLHVLTTFLRFLRRAVDVADHLDGCTHLAVIFDSPSGSNRKKLFADYKGNRKDFSEEEDSPFLHLPYIYRALDFLGIKHLEVTGGIEADDAIATLATRFVYRSRTKNSWIVSHDSDFYQLLNHQIRQIKLASGQGYVTMDVAALKLEIGVTPGQYVRYKSLVGDTADNIPGVPAIGRVRARKIITGETVVDLSAFKDIISRNEELILLQRNAPVKILWRELEFLPERLSVKNTTIFEKCKF